jgi:hypothetical protein
MLILNPRDPLKNMTDSNSKSWKQRISFFKTFFGVAWRVHCILSLIRKKERKDMHIIVPIGLMFPVPYCSSHESISK